MLVNNAGLGELTTGRIHGYHKHPLNELCLMSNLNAVVPSIMFKMILPRMESNRLGLCIMMGSAAGMAPIATLPTYGATKSFVMHLTKSLRVGQSLLWFKSKLGGHGPAHQTVHHRPCPFTFLQRAVDFLNRPCTLNQSYLTHFIQAKIPDKIYLASVPI